MENDVVKRILIFFATLSIGLGVALVFILPAFTQDMNNKPDVKYRLQGQDAMTLLSLTGNWRIDTDGANQVYAVDGSRRVQGEVSPTARDNAAALYGDRSHVFLRNILLYKSFPLSIYQDAKNFSNGTISVSFKTISGKEDQAAGIAFNIKENGEYLVVRANALENNLILFSFSNGQRFHVKDIENVPTIPHQWHTLKIVVQGDKIEGYLDDNKYLYYRLNEKVSGRIGLWSKSDSHILFNTFNVQTK